MFYEKIIDYLYFNITKITTSFLKFNFKCLGFNKHAKNYTIKFHHFIIFLYCFAMYAVYNTMVPYRTNNQQWSICNFSKSAQCDLRLFSSLRNPVIFLIFN